MATVREVIARLKSNNKDLDTHIAVSVWGDLDIRCRAEELDIELTDDEVNDVLDNLTRNHDATLGINWDVIDATIEFMSEKG